MNDLVVGREPQKGASRRLGSFDHVSGSELTCDRLRLYLAASESRKAREASLIKTGVRDHQRPPRGNRGRLPGWKEEDGRARDDDRRETFDEILRSATIPQGGEW